MSTPRRFAFAAAALAFLAPAVAPAQDDDPARRAAAQALFDRASALIDAHDYAAACPKLEEVLRLQPGKVGTMMTLGECYEGQGRMASAWIQYRATADRAAAANDARGAKAQAKVTAIEPKVPKLRVQVDAATKALSGLEVKRDGQVIGPGQWGDPVPVDPGQHVVEAQAPGQQPLRIVVQLKEGEAKDATVKFSASGPAAAPPPSPSPSAPAASPETSSGGGISRRTVGLVVGGVGVVGLGVGGVLGLVTLLKSNSANGTTACTGPATQANVDACNALRDSARGMQSGAIAAAVVGVVAAGAGVALFLTAPRDADKHKAASLALVVQGGGASLSGSF